MEINYINQTKENVDNDIKLIDSIFKNVNEKYVMSIIFVSKEEIHRINKEYRGVDRVTDVISFAIRDNGSDFLEDEIGDIFICLDKAYEQSIEYNHSKEREVGFLAVHGYLHLLGYDHMNDEDEKVMMSKAEEILLKANLSR